MPIPVEVSGDADIHYTLVLDELRAQMARRHLSQHDLARLAGFKQAMISRRLTGQTALTLPELFDVCSVLGMSATELLEAAERNQPRAGRSWAPWGSNPQPTD